jgi:hypothetical protein
MSGKNNGNNSNNEEEGWKSIPDSAITKSWGGMMSFMGSYMLKPTPEGFEEAREILDAFKKADYEDMQRDSRSSNNGSNKSNKK